MPLSPSILPKTSAGPSEVYMLTNIWLLLLLPGRCLLPRALVLRKEVSDKWLWPGSDRSFVVPEHGTTQTQAAINAKSIPRQRL